MAALDPEAAHEVATRTPLQAALDRLEATRADLRRELVPVQEPPAAGQAGARWSLSWRVWRRRLRRWPMGDVALRALHGWWAQHPWRPVSQLVAGELKGGITPWVKRNPLTAVATAAALGGVMMAVRPWRWTLVREQLRPLPRQLMRSLLEPLTSAPMQTALLAWLLSTLRNAGEPSPEGCADDPPLDPQAAAGNRGATNAAQAGATDGRTHTDDSHPAAP